MGYTIQDIPLYLRVTMMQTGYKMLKSQNLIVLICLHRVRSTLIEILKTNGFARSIMEFDFISLDKCREDAE